MDLIDQILIDWNTQRPDIDVSGKKVICSLLHAYSHVILELEKSFKPQGITPNIFSALVTIRRKGPEGEVTVKNLMNEALVTSGAMSNLVNKLVELGFVTKRKANEQEDARATHVKLTSKGFDLINKAMNIQAACERRLTRSLSAREKSQLAGLLKKINSEGSHYNAC